MPFYYKKKVQNTTSKVKGRKQIVRKEHIMRTKPSTKYNIKSKRRKQIVRKEHILRKKNKNNISNNMTNRCCREMLSKP